MTKQEEQELREVIAELSKVVYKLDNLVSEYEEDEEEDDSDDSALLVIPIVDTVTTIVGIAAYNLV